MGKRGQNEGTIRKRPEGRWEARVSVNGRQRSVYGPTREEAARRMRAVQGKAESGIPLSDERLTVGAYLTRWLETAVRPSVRPRTYTSYESHVRLHLAPAFGRVPLAKLRPDQVQELMNAQLAAGLSPNTVLRVRATLRRALNQALRWGMVSRNVATMVDAPQARRFRVEPMSEGDAAAVLEAVRGDSLEALYTLALAVGLRQGEALGLHWSDVDLESGALTIRTSLQRIAGELTLVEPKTESSRRTVPLPTVAATSLRQHRSRQGRARLLAGDAWTDTGLVFTTAHGRPLAAQNVLRSLRRMLARAGMPPYRFHDLRHGCASLLLAEGVGMRVIMETLGHSQIGHTMNTYAHVMPRLQREAADRMDAALARTKTPG